MKMGKGIKGKFVEIRNLPQSVLLRNKIPPRSFEFLCFLRWSGVRLRGKWMTNPSGHDVTLMGRGSIAPQIIAKMKNDFLRLCGEKCFAIFACLREIKSLLQTPPGNISYCFISLFVWPTNWSSTNVLRLKTNLLITGVMTFTFRTWDETIHVWVRGNEKENQQNFHEDSSK